MPSAFCGVLLKSSTANSLAFSQTCKMEMEVTAKMPQLRISEQLCLKLL